MYTQSENGNGWNVIVGAGFSGLTAALILARHGQKCLLLEKEPEVGGLCRSLTMDDIIFDVGPHVLFNGPDLPDCPEMEFYPLKDIQLLRRRFLFAMHARGRYWNFPLTPFEVLTYPMHYKRDIIRQTARKLRSRSKNNNPSIETMISTKSGIRFYNDVFASLMEKKAGLAGRDIHHDWYLRTGRDFQWQFCAPDFVRTGFIQGVCRSVSGRFPYYYPENGFGDISSHLWRSYRDAGGETILNTGNTSLHVSRDRVCSIRVNDSLVFPVQNLVWTGSLKNLVTQLDVVIPDIVSMDLYVVYITYQKPDTWKPCPWVYVYHSDKNVIFTRSYYPSSIYRHISGDIDGVALEIHGTEAVNSMNINEILDKTVADAVACGLVRRDHIRQLHIQKYTDSVPVYPLNYRRTVTDIYSGLNRFKNLYAIGKPGSFYYCLSKGAMRHGIQTARRILNGSAEGERVVMQ